MGVKVLLVDRSGRGHAFADLFTRTHPSVTVYYAPGSPGITTERVVPLPELSLAEPQGLVELALRRRVDFVLVSHTNALVGGVADLFRRHGLPVIGPGERASRLEASKIDTKELCARHGIPVAEFAAFDDRDRAIDYARRAPYAVVVKADGLCAGNGSFVCDGPEDAVRAIELLMSGRQCGAAGARVLIERRLYGIEVSFFALLDGRSFLLLPMAFDYPKSDDGDRGVTCGGMGSFSPHPLEGEELAAQARRRLFEPLMALLAAEGIDFTGVVYLGCMLTADGLHLLEINVRMGDPEAQAVLPRVDTDFVDLCEAVLGRRLAGRTLAVNDLSFCNVALTQGATRQRSGGRSKGWYAGWPYGRYGKGYAIHGLDDVDPEECRLFFGEVSAHPQKGLVTDGGRVLHVAGYGADRERAADNAYRNAAKIHFEGVRYRTDVGRLIARGGVENAEPIAPPRRAGERR